MVIFKKIGYWFKNYWYYYKWIVIVAAFFIGVIVFCLVQSETKEEYDVTILYTGPHLFEIGEVEEFESTLRQVMSDDYDGDGKKNASLMEMPAFTEEQLHEALGENPEYAEVMVYAPYTVNEVRENFSKQVFAGDTVICFLDPYWYRILKDADGLVPLAEVLGYEPEGLLDAYSVSLSSLGYFRFFSQVQKLPADTVVCFRRQSTASSVIGKEEAKDNYQRSISMLKDLFAFRNE